MGASSSETQESLVVMDSTTFANGNYKSYSQIDTSSLYPASNTTSSNANVDIWNNLTHSQLQNELSNTRTATSAANSTLSNSASHYDTATSFPTSLPGSNTNTGKSKLSNVEMDPLSFQMLQLSTKDPSSSLSNANTPSMIQNSYFSNSNIGFNRQFNDTEKENNNSKSINAVSNQRTNLHPHNNTNWPNSNTYTSYLLQQQQQHQAQGQAQEPLTNHHVQAAQNYQHFNYKSKPTSQPPSYNNPTQSQFLSNQLNYFNTNTNSNTNNVTSPNHNNHQFTSSFDPRNLKKTITHELLTAEDEQFDNESYRTKLQLKDIIISKLESELEKMKEFHDTVLKTKGNTQGDFEVPKNYEELYHKLVDKIQSTEAELNDTKLRLESLVTAISMNPNPTNYKNGRYDEQEVSHKIISKLKLLSEENEELSRMLSYGKSKEKDIEIALLRKQNNDLLEKVSKLEAKLNDTK